MMKCHLFFLLGLCFFQGASSISFSKLFFSSSSSVESSKSDQKPPRKLLPQLPPHRDTQYLVEFVTDKSPSVDYMQPLVERVEDDLNVKVRKINLNARPDFMTLFDAICGNEGGNVPFFYNRRTTRAICGATTYENLQALFLGGAYHSFNELPVSVGEDQGPRSRSVREMNALDHLKEVYARSKLGLKGKSGKARKTDEEEEDDDD